MMSLRLLGLDQGDLAGTVSRIDQASDTVTIVTVERPEPLDPAPLHYRIGDWSSPPVDIAIDHRGRFQSITITLDDSLPPLVTGNATEATAAGIPLFEVERWPPDRFLDVRRTVGTNRFADGSLLVTLSEDAGTEVVKVGPEITMVFAADHALNAVVVRGVFRARPDADA
jgi:hypothetical protein